MRVTNQIPSLDRPKSLIDKPSLPSQCRKVSDAVGDISNKNTQALQKNGGGRHHNDGNSAIELFLDDSASMSTVGTRSLKKNQSKFFMNRWFCGSRHHPAQDGVKARPSIQWYYQHSDKTWLDFPTLRNARSFKDFPTNTKSSQNHRIPSGNSYQQPSMYQGNGPQASIHHDPYILDNDTESIGTRSMEEIRSARKLMNQRLNEAPDAEHGISREKVIQALFKVADSLEDMDERTLMRKELEGIIQAEGQIDLPNSKKTRSIQIRPKYLRWYFKNHESDGHRAESAGLAPTQSTRIQRNNKANSNLASSTRSGVHALNDEKKAVENALDDLLWTEFVVNRRRKDETNHDSRVLRRTGMRRRDNHKAHGSRKTNFEVKEPLPTEPVDESLHISNLCWGATGLTTASTCTNNEASSSSSPSEGGTDDLDTGSDEEYDDASTTDSEPNRTYLPTRITVTQPSSEENTLSSPLPSSFPLVPSRSDFHNAMKPRNARNRVHFE